MTTATTTFGILVQPPSTLTSTVERAIATLKRVGQYHDGKLAINVKHHSRIDGSRIDGSCSAAQIWLNQDKNATRVYEDVREDWWRAWTERAWTMGLQIAPGGRSGGWVELTNTKNLSDVQAHDLTSAFERIRDARAEVSRLLDLEVPATAEESAQIREEIQEAFLELEDAASNPLVALVDTWMDFVGEVQASMREIDHEFAIDTRRLMEDDGFVVPTAKVVVYTANTLENRRDVSKIIDQAFPKHAGLAFDSKLRRLEVEVSLVAPLTSDQELAVRQVLRTRLPSLVPHGDPISFNVTSDGGDPAEWVQRCF